MPASGGDVEMPLVDLGEARVDDLLVQLFLLLEAEHACRRGRKHLGDRVERDAMELGVERRDIAVQRSGAAGLSGLGVEELARFAVPYLGTSPQPSYDPEMSAAEALKRACDDLKAFYLEAASAQPGNLGAAALEQWFWRETAAGRLFLMLRQACLESADKSLRTLGEKLLVPRVIANAK
jgi:hypothetical protein